MICKICGVNETNNPDGICDDCKLSILFNKDIPPNIFRRAVVHPNFNHHA